MARSCDVVDCNRKYLARGLCQFHYNRSPRVMGKRRQRYHALTPEQKRERKIQQRLYYLADIENRKAKSREYEKARYAADPEGSKRRSRSRQLRLRYGLSREDYEALVAAQFGCCAICGERDKSLCVDHDHSTGKIRELLCSSCNLAISHLRDDPSRALAAHEYLNRHRF